MQIKNPYKQELDEQQVKWNTQIDQLFIKVAGARADLKLRYAREINEIRAKQRELATMVRDLENVSGDTLAKIRMSADQRQVEQDLPGASG